MFANGNRPAFQTIKYFPPFQTTIRVRLIGFFSVASLNRQILIASSADNWDQMKERTSEAERFGHLTNLKGIVHVGKEGGGKKRAGRWKKGKKTREKEKEKGEGDNGNRETRGFLVPFTAQWFYSQITFFFYFPHTPSSSCILTTPFPLFYFYNPPGTPAVSTTRFPNLQNIILRILIIAPTTSSTKTGLNHKVQNSHSSKSFFLRRAVTQQHWKHHQ